MSRRVFDQQSTAFTINLSFGFMLRNVETGELRYCHSSINNNRYLDIPHRIRNEEDLERFIEEIVRQDLLRIHLTTASGYQMGGPVDNQRYLLRQIPAGLFTLCVFHLKYYISRCSLSDRTVSSKHHQ